MYCKWSGYCVHKDVVNRGATAKHGRAVYVGEGFGSSAWSRVRGHFALGGTLINMNVISKQQILEAHKDPSKYPNLIVRVTGFSLLR